MPPSSRACSSAAARSASTATTRTVAPFERYVGLRLPKGDASRDMLLTDTKHTVELASLDPRRQAGVASPRLQVTLYKMRVALVVGLERRFAGAVRAGRRARPSIKQETVATKDGAGQWQFEIKYPEWGRYLIRACDLDGGHCTGRVFYIDWPSWAGAAREQSGPGGQCAHAHRRQAGIQGGRDGHGPAARGRAGPRAADARERQLGARVPLDRSEARARIASRSRSPRAWRPTSTWP